MTTWHVPFNDLVPKHLLLGELSDAFMDVMMSGNYEYGENVLLFEQEFADYIGVNHCISLANGFEALVIALRAVGADRYDVAVPANAPLPTWMAVTQSGNNIFPIKPESKTMLMGEYNYAQEHNLSSYDLNIKVVLPVHLYGSAVDVVKLRANNPRMIVIEDCSRAHGAMVGMNRVGSMGDVGTWSFSPTANLGSYADGGAITTNDDVIADFAKKMRVYGDGYMRGIDSSLSELQAAFLRVKLRTLDEDNQNRLARAMRYDENLSRVSALQIPAVRKGDVYNKYVIATDSADARNKLYDYLRSYGVEVLIHYPVVPGRMRAYIFHQDDAIDNAQALADRIVSLPIASASDNQIDFVSEKIREFYRQ